MTLRPPDMSSCEPKCKCGANSLAPGVVYNCDNPCGGNVPFDAEKCECGIGEPFSEFFVNWQNRRDINGVTQGYTIPGWYNGYQSWRSWVGSGGYENRVYPQYVNFNTFGCISDGNWSNYRSKGAIDVYYYLDRTDPEGSNYLEGRGGCYWGEDCESCWYARPSDPPYNRRTYNIDGRVTATRWNKYIDPETGQTKRRNDLYVLYYGDLVEGEPGYVPLPEFTDPELDEADPTRRRVVDLRGEYAIQRVIDDTCSCTVTDAMKGRLD